MDVLLFLSAFSVLFFLFQRLLQPQLTLAYCKRMIADPTTDTDILPCEILRASFPSSQIFNSLSLPIPGREGEEITLGTVAVNRSGIYIICQIIGGGIIENPSASSWRHMINGSAREFDNPFRAQSDARELIEYYAKNSGLGCAKCHSLVVYTSNSLKFTNTPSRQIIPASELNRRFSLTDKHGRLSKSEVNGICRMLSDINRGIIF